MKFITKHILLVSVVLTAILTVTTFVVRPTPVHATGSCVTDSFCTTWQTTSDGESITLPTYPGYIYSYDIDWGDGSTDTAQTGDAVHVYATAGTYTVSITGTFPAIYFNDGGDKDKILSIEQWGTIQWSTMSRAFQGCVNLQGNAIDVPDLSLIVFMDDMFSGSTSFNQNISSWDVSNVTDMTRMFDHATSFNQDISSWDVSNVTTMSDMFNHATAFNQPLNSWNVSSVTNMNNMFANTSFNQPLDSWDVSSVTNMGKMFEGNEYFNQNINTWNVSSVTNMNGVFHDAFSFNQPLSLWDVSNVVDMYGMFANAHSFNQPLNAWGSKTSNVTSMRNLFTNAFAFDQNISDWDVSQVTDFGAMFAGTNFNQPLNSWDMSSAVKISYMFGGNSSFNQPLDLWDVSHVDDMTGMFIGAVSFDQNLSSWDVSQVTSMSSVYGGFLTGVTLSVRNYDALLASWSQQSLQPGLSFDGGNSNYCRSGAQRSEIIDTYGWVVTDGGKECPKSTVVGGFSSSSPSTSKDIVVVPPNQNTPDSKNEAPNIVFTRIIKNGIKGDDVKKVQMYLTSHGFPLTPDGSFGPRTKSAVMAFQKSKSLIADGIIGPKTAALMK